MNVRYRVELSQAERHELTTMLGGGKHAASKVKRAQILLETDALPVGHDQVHWQAQAPANLQPEIARSETWARDVASDCCQNLLVVHHSDFDVLIPSHSRMGKFSGGRRISMLRGTPG